MRNKSFSDKIPLNFIVEEAKMTAIAMTEKIKHELIDFLKSQRSPELLAAYLFFIEKKFHLRPVVFVKDKMIFSSADESIARLEKEGKLWHKTEIKIGYGPPTVNDQTKKIYICPYTGKVFADNTHPNPQDAIYDWVSTCPENHERMGGVKVKRFFVSEDPEVIKNYIEPRKQPIAKSVFSSALTGKLFNSKEAVIEDFKEHFLRPMTLVEVQNQNRFQLDPQFLEWLQTQLQEDKIASFVEVLADDEMFHPYVTKWVEAE